MNDNVVLYWSRAPGNFVKKYSGEEVFKGTLEGYTGPKFHGTVREWYETLIETITDTALECSGLKPLPKEGQELEDLFGNITQIVLGLKGKITVSRDVLTILECTVPFKANLKHWDLGIPIQEGLVGVINNRFEVHLSDKQPINEITVESNGRTGKLIVKDLCVL